MGVQIGDTVFRVLTKDLDLLHGFTDGTDVGSGSEFHITPVGIVVWKLQVSITFMNQDSIYHGLVLFPVLVDTHDPALRPAEFIVKNLTDRIPAGEVKLRG